MAKMKEPGLCTPWKWEMPSTVAHEAAKVEGLLNQFKGIHYVER
jgi:hypothetical protein